MPAKLRGEGVEEGKEDVADKNMNYLMNHFALVESLTI